MRVGLSYIYAFRIEDFMFEKLVLRRRILDLSEYKQTNLSTVFCVGSFGFSCLLWRKKN